MSRAVYQRRTVTCLATLTESDCTVVLQQNFFTFGSKYRLDFNFAFSNIKQVYIWEILRRLSL